MMRQVLSAPEWFLQWILAGSIGIGQTYGPCCPVRFAYGMCEVTAPTSDIAYGAGPFWCC